MTRGLRQRIEKLEGDLGDQSTPNVIVATCPIPERDRPFGPETIERWLAEGLAHIAFRGHAVLYDGGRGHPLTIEEWHAAHCSIPVSMHWHGDANINCTPAWQQIILTGCQPLTNMVEAAQECTHMRKLFTVGYEGSKPADLFTRLQSNGVALLIDVRDVPISRKPGFSKTALAHGLDEVGIRYLHLKGLGDPKPGRTAAREGRFSDFRRIFTAHMMTTAAQQALAEAVTAASKSVACLLCFEQDHTNCHRCIVADSMARSGKFNLVHLSVSPLANSKVLRGQISSDDRTPAHIG
jgi:hypothetical protein